jgi:hypothetical protein
MISRCFQIYACTTGLLNEVFKDEKCSDIVDKLPGVKARLKGQVLTNLGTYSELAIKSVAKLYTRMFSTSPSTALQTNKQGPRVAAVVSLMSWLSVYNSAADAKSIKAYKYNSAKAVNKIFPGIL